MGFGRRIDFRTVVEFVIGILIAFFVAAIGSEIYTQAVLKKSLFTNYRLLANNDLLSKVMTIGSLLIIPVVYFLLSRRWYITTRGVLAGLILLVVISQIV